MQLRYLRYFVATAEAGSVSAAAQTVHVTQPALSRQLRQLEHELGVALFDRSAGRLSLNRTGRALLPAAKDLLAAADDLKTAAAFHAQGRRDRITVAAPTVTLTDVVSPFVATMAADDPVLDVRPADGSTTAEMLQAGADLAIGTQTTQAPYASRPLAVLPVWAYVPTDDPWSSRDRVDLAELLERQVIGLPPTYTAREALDTAVAAAGAGIAHFTEAANGTIAQALAAASRGVAVVSDDPRYDLVPLAVDTGTQVLSINLFAGWDARSIAAGELESLAHRLETWVRRRYPLPSP